MLSLPALVLVMNGPPTPAPRAARAARAADAPPAAQSRLAPVYEEVAPVLGVFGRLFGKALEAQVGAVAS
jgi:hypothetical protein